MTACIRDFDFTYNLGGGITEIFLQNYKQVRGEEPLSMGEAFRWAGNTPANPIALAGSSILSTVTQINIATSKLKPLQLYMKRLGGDTLHGPPACRQSPPASFP